MGIIWNRVTAISAYLGERGRNGVPETMGNLDDEVVFILDGVGGAQFGPVLIRRALREEGHSLGTVVYDWQCGLRGEIWTDLMWLRRNRVMGARLARKLLAFRRDHPQATVHLVSYSGGTGIAVFALERLRGRPLIETLVMPCPALSPTYNLGPALRAVERAYALVSPKDWGILGLGTQIFGTTDRQFCHAAGRVGFRIPADATAADVEAYERLREIPWSRELRRYGHHGGHTGWAGVPFLRAHLLPILRGDPLLPVRPVAAIAD